MAASAMRLSVGVAARRRSVAGRRGRVTQEQRREGPPDRAHRCLTEELKPRPERRFPAFGQRRCGTSIERIVLDPRFRTILETGTPPSARMAFSTTATSMASWSRAPWSGVRWPSAAATMPAIDSPSPPARFAARWCGPAGRCAWPAAADRACRRADDVRGLRRRRGAPRAERHAEIGGGQGRRVVDPVADHHHRAVVPLADHDRGLGGRIEIGRHIVDGKAGDERLRDGASVAGGEHHPLDAAGAQRGERPAPVGPQRVGEIQDGRGPAIDGDQHRRDGAAPSGPDSEGGRRDRAGASGVRRRPGPAGPRPIRRRPPRPPRHVRRLGERQAALPAPAPPGLARSDGPRPDRGRRRAASPRSRRRAERCGPVSGTPVRGVSVPVLSITRTRMRASASRAPPPLMRTPMPAAEDRPETRATGTPRISGQGVATTSTASARSDRPWRPMRRRR